jgi:transaldolase
MRKLVELHDRFGQSPWLDAGGHDGVVGTGLAGWLGDGVRGVTSNAAFGLDAISGLWNGEYLIGPLTDRGRSVESIYGQALVERLARSSFLLRPVFEESGASDGFVSVGIAPRFARDSEALVRAASELYQRVPEPNLMVEIPATSEGISAVRRLVSEGRSVNVTLIVTLARYRQVIDAYLAGLESLGGNLSRCHCVASLAIGPVDAEVDRRLEGIGTASALSLRLPDVRGAVLWRQVAGAGN